LATILIKGSPTSPLVKFDSGQGLLEISGRAIEENSMEFFKPVFEAIQKYASAPAENTEINIKLEYINTASTRCLLEIFKDLDAIFKQGHKMVVNWYYEEDDEGMLDTGKDVLALSQIPFNLIPVEVM